MHQTKPTYLSIPDRIICQFDRALRTLTPDTQGATRPSPASKLPPTPELAPQERKHAAGLMRVNHAGEVCAQALYQGQALTAKLPLVRDEMEIAAAEEVDHLAWCEERIKELNSHTSLLNPLWYGLSFGIGAGAGLISDKVSLGFVAATEDQVCQHLQDHLTQLPEQDLKSRAVVTAMLKDEYLHGENALKAGGYRFPKPVKLAMRAMSKLMTVTSYRV